MKSLLVLGDEAVGQGAIDSGVSGIYAYPGTPSTEIMQYVQNCVQRESLNIHSKWSTNEKTAFEAALGMSYAGKRTMICMKHVGLNVAADAFMNAAITGVNGGLVVVVADDPGMHSSQNEQDSRYYARFAMIPLLEPSNQQEAYSAVFTAFDLSEKYEIPVMLRLTTRLAHGRAGIKTREAILQNNLNPYEKDNRYILLPVNARKQFKWLIDKQRELEEEAENAVLNYFSEGASTSLGVLACGIGYNYVMEVLVSNQLEVPILKIGQYPMPQNLVNKLFDACDSVLIIEEGYPVYEEYFRGFFDAGKKIKGKLDGTLPRTGELNPDQISYALGIEPDRFFSASSKLKSRPPALCKGCGHRDVFLAINEIIDKKHNHVFSDIGCYTLGALAPFNAISTCVEMGASVAMAKGAADAGLRPAIAVIGDSTFTHSGMTGLMDAVNDKSAVTIVISDNSTTAMTGGQPAAGKGKYFDICKAIGVKDEHIKIIIPLKKNHSENVELLKKEFAYEGVSVVIAQRECVKMLLKKNKSEKQLL